MTIATLILTCLLSSRWADRQRLRPDRHLCRRGRLHRAANAGGNVSRSEDRYLSARRRSNQQIGLVIGVVTSASGHRLDDALLHQVFGIARRTSPRRRRR